MGKIGSNLRSSYINADVNLAKQSIFRLGSSASPHACLNSNPLNKGPLCNRLEEAVRMLAALENPRTAFPGASLDFLRAPSLI